MVTLTSDAFDNNGDIPQKYTCDGADVNPPLRIGDIPDNTESLVLIVDDPDAIKPAGKVWDHWVVFNIPPETTVIEEDSVPGTEGQNTFGRTSWGGPCPPDGEHTYVFKLYALDAELDLDASATKKDVEAAMEGHVLEKTELRGNYNRT